MYCSAFREQIGQLGCESAVSEELLKHALVCHICQNELAKYTRMLKMLEAIKAEYVPAPPTLFVEVMESIEEIAKKKAIVSALKGRRLLYLLGSLTALVSGTCVLAAAKSFRKRAKVFAG